MSQIPKDIPGNSEGKIPGIPLGIWGFDSKGAILMTLFPLMECCELLAIDPKTLRHWLKQATMSLSVHPLDGRRKCLTWEQVQHLAILHDRMLKGEEARLTTTMVQIPPLGALQEPAHPQMMSRVIVRKSTSPGELEERDLSQKLTHLQTQVEVLQRRLVLLTQDLLEAREAQLEPPNLFVQQAGEQEIMRPENPITSVPIQQGGATSRVRRLHPAEQRAQQRALTLVLPALIEYGAAGSYIIISSQEGELPLIPDSPEWFDWFKTLSSFRFVGKCGRFGTTRGYKLRPTRTWYAYRTIHQHDYKHYLGLSEHLTIAHLEAMAAKFQSYVDTL